MSEFAYTNLKTLVQHGVYESQIKKNIVGFLCAIKPKPYLDIDEYGSRLSNSNDIVSYEKGCVTNYYEIPDGDTKGGLYVASDAPTVTYDDGLHLCIFDSNLNVLTYYNAFTVRHNKQFDFNIPNGAKFIRFTLVTNYKDSSYCITSPSGTQLF